MSFGNEMFGKGAVDWDGYMLPWVKAKITEMDNAGFQNVKVLFVWAFGIIDNIRGLRDFPFLKKMVSQYPDRWVWSVNVYSIWDTSIWPTSPNDCKQKVAAAVDMAYVKALMTDFRKAVSNYTGNNDDPL